MIRYFFYFFSNIRNAKLLKKQPLHYYIEFILIFYFILLHLFATHLTHYHYLASTILKLKIKGIVVFFCFSLSFFLSQTLHFFAFYFIKLSQLKSTKPLLLAQIISRLRGKKSGKASKIVSF